MFKIIVFLLFFFTQVLSAVPDAITDLSVVETNWRRIKLQWTVPPSAEPVVRYEIRCSTYKILSTEQDWETNSSENGYPYRVTIDTSTLQGTVTSYVFVNLQNGKPYFFAIKSSTDTEGNIFSAIDSNTSRPFGIPTNTSPPGFNLDTPTEGMLVISQNISFDWQDVNDIDVVYGDSLKYEVYYATYYAR
ncbi:MAG: fibronectin type III domain-containing protein, partial [Endomicrobiia bacterium]